MKFLALIICMPAAAASQAGCPWMNAATARGVLGGAVEVTVTPTSCGFVRHDGAGEFELRIEVGGAGARQAACPVGSESLKTIGNEAAACSYEGKTGWAAEQVVGRVRDQSFLVRISVNNGAIEKKELREKARGAAEQVAGSLF
jgi:hypothetical protein